MLSSEDRQVIDRNGGAAEDARLRTEARKKIDRYTGILRTAPKGADSAIGDDETHRRLQEARNRARHSTEDMIRRELGPEWVE
jgi:hypothetical protein